MIVQNKAQQAGYRDYNLGIPKNRNPFQYSSDIFKQAAWSSGWVMAEKERKAVDTL